MTANFPTEQEKLIQRLMADNRQHHVDIMRLWKIVQSVQSGGSQVGSVFGIPIGFGGQGTGQPFPVPVVLEPTDEGSGSNSPAALTGGPVYDISGSNSASGIASGSSSPYTADSGTGTGGIQNGTASEDSGTGTAGISSGTDSADSGTGTGGVLNGTASADSGTGTGGIQSGTNEGTHSADSGTGTGGSDGGSGTFGSDGGSGTQAVETYDYAYHCFGSTGPAGAITNGLDRYDFAADSWGSRTNMWSTVMYCGHGSSLTAHGIGWTIDGGWWSPSERHDTGTHTFSSDSSGTTVNSPDWKYQHCSSYYEESSSDHRGFSMGGHDFSSNLKTYNQRWYYLGTSYANRTSLSSGRRLLSAATLGGGGEIVMFGGHDGGAMDEVESWDETSWSTRTALADARWGTASMEYNDLAYCAGGHDGSHRNDNTRYDLVGDSHSPKTSISTATQHAVFDQCGNGGCFSGGHASGDYYVDDYQNYNVSTDSFSSLSTDANFDADGYGGGGFFSN